MSTIGLYDTDLFHYQKHHPNLELMKIYSYHNRKGDKVLMMRPGDEEGRFNKIIYFKDHPNFLLPRGVNVYGKNKEIYGYGFVKSYFPIDKIYQNEPPCYDPYIEYKPKFKNPPLSIMMNNSFIRFENKDFTDFKKNCNHIIIADHQFCYLPDADLFRKEYWKYKFDYLHKLEIRDKETFYKFKGFNDNRKYFINFNFDEDFIRENYNQHITLNWTKRENETELHYLLRCTTLILFFKTNNANPDIKIKMVNGDGLYKDILYWGAHLNQLSFEEFYKDDKKVTGRLIAAPSELRFLLKEKPSKLKSSDIDFSEIL